MADFLRIVAWMYCGFAMLAAVIATVIAVGHLADEVSGWFALLFLLFPLVLMALVVSAYEIAVWLGLEQ